MNPYDCPRCGSSNTQSFENTHAQNVRQSYGIHGRYDSWNQLAMQTAPPQKPHAGCASIFVVFLLTLFTTVLTGTVLNAFLKSFGDSIDLNTRAGALFWVTVLVAVVTFIAALLFNSRKVNKQMPVYNQKVEKWNRSMLCQRCSCVWLLGDNSSYTFFEGL